MTTRAQDSPFRETAWDQRLDKMLDDLKTTVTVDGDAFNRKDNNLVSSFSPQYEDKPETKFLDVFRSTSRSDSRSSGRVGIDDGGLMKHEHKEYTSPDKSTKVVSDHYEYESGDPNKHYTKKLMKSTYSDYKVSGEISSGLDALKQGPDPALMRAAAATADYHTDAKGSTNTYSTNSYTSTKTNKYEMANGKRYDDDDVELIHEPSGGEVRRIVWRNRFEKTHEAQDGTPSISIEEEARRKKRQYEYEKYNSSKVSSYMPPPPQRGPVSPRQLQLQYAVYWPNYSPNISPGGQAWPDPIPMPTPPQISPKGEPGVAYVYTYGQPGSQVQHLPPLNYVTEGAPSPTPSGSQPIIYHYSYHYTMQPGQAPPEAGHHPPALQLAPGDAGPHVSAVRSYDLKKHTTTTTTTTDKEHHVHDRPHVEHHVHDRPHVVEHRFPTDADGVVPSKPGGADRNISITINKSSHVTRTHDYPPVGPATSTPFATHDSRRSRSSSPDRYRRGPPQSPTTHHTHHDTSYVTHVTRTSHSDSLERLRRPPHEGLPFPDTTPIKPSEGPRIPKKVDELMTSLDSEDGSRRVEVNAMNGPRSPMEKEPLISTKVSSHQTDLTVNESFKKTDVKKEEAKNIAGPPVYYPPGHHQLFDESMHTMTLKENKRRGMAKWRMEKASGYKESASSSESKGGMAMVPVCLPLCCGAACAIM